MGEAVLVGALTAAAVLVARSGLAQKRDLETLSGHVDELAEEVERLRDQLESASDPPDWLDDPY